MRHTVVFLVLLIVISVVQCSYGQRIEQKRFIKFTQENGLSSYNIRKVIQDRYGFIWAATQDGLSRFDGNQFINYRKSSYPNYRLLGTDIRDVTEDTVRNLLWVLPGEVGLNAIDVRTGKVVRSIPIPNADPEEWYMSMVLQGDKLWIGSFKGICVYNISSQQFEQVDAAYKVVQNQSIDFETYHLFPDRYQNVWACMSGKGIVIFDGHSNRIRKMVPISQFNCKNNSLLFLKSANLHSGDVLLGTSEGLKVVQYNDGYDIKVNSEPCTVMSELNSSFITSLVNKDGTLFIGTQNSFYRINEDFSGGSIIEDIVKADDGNWANAVQYLYFDKEKNLWIGCQAGLSLLSKNESLFVPVFKDVRSNISLDHVRSLFLKDTNVVLAGLRNGLVQIDMATHRFAAIDTGRLIHHMFKDGNGFIHVSTNKGWCLYDNGRLISCSAIYPELSDYSDYTFNSHLFLNDSVILLGTECDQGILAWNVVSHKVAHINRSSSPAQLSADIVNNIFQDTYGSIWVLSDNGISVIDKMLKQSIFLQYNNPSTGLPCHLFFDMCEAKGYYWIAAYGEGILKVDKRYNLVKIYSLTDGLSNDGVYNLFNVGDSSLFITTNDGLNRFDIDQQYFRNYYVADGLHANGFEEVSSFRNGRYIYAGGINGFTKINVGLFLRNTTPPKLYFTGIVTHTPNGSKDTIDVGLLRYRFPRNWLQTTISFSGINYSNMSSVVYRYKIMEIDTGWINIGHRNFVTLLGLKPTTYRLQVMAANEDGVWSDPIELTLIFQPKWHQAWWFKSIVALFIMGVLYGLYRYRLWQIRKEQEIRQRIASDLHDDIGSTLNSVKVFTNLAIMKPENNIPYLEQLKEGVQGAIVGVRDMVWVLDDKQDTIDHLVNRIDLFINPLATAQDIEFEKSIDPALADKMLRKEEKRNLYLILKEALNNSIKYSDASTLQLRVYKTPNDKFSISIHDNGKGFDLASVQRGNGLNNLQYRAQQIKYRLEIDSTPGKGTLIVLTRS